MSELEEKCHSGCEGDCGNKECRNQTKIAILERRVNNLEEGQNREEAFRKTYYSDRDATTVRNARLDAKISNMDEKLNSIKKWVDEQNSRHSTRWEIVVKTAIELFTAALVGYVLCRIGL